ncbi:MAG: hypothetical protein Q4C04_00400 [Clostridia bacterium]|nr:hypothetical protein [Clostridia bacterium]
MYSIICVGRVPVPPLLPSSSLFGAGVGVGLEASLHYHDYFRLLFSFSVIVSQYEPCGGLFLKVLCPE